MVLYDTAGRLAVDEPLPEAWACHGTSGYDFLNMANGLFVDAALTGRAEVAPSVGDAATPIEPAATLDKGNSGLDLAAL